MDESCSTMSWYCMKAECCGRVLWRTISASLEARLRPRHMTPSTSSSTGRRLTGEWPRERSRTPACAKPLGTCRRCEKGRCSNTPTPIRIGGIGRELLPTMVWGMVCMAVMQGLCARYALRCSRIPRWRCCASRCWRWRMLLDAYTDFAPTEIDGCGITETLPAYQWAVGALDRRLSTVEEGAGPAFAPQDAARISRAISDARAECRAQAMKRGTDGVMVQGASCLVRRHRAACGGDRRAMFWGTTHRQGSPRWRSPRPCRNCSWCSHWSSSWYGRRHTPSAASHDHVGC